MKHSEPNYYGPGKNPKTPPIGYNVNTGLFTYHNGRQIASGYWTGEGFRIKTGSMVWKHNTLRGYGSLLAIRDEMIRNGTLVWEFDTYYIFTKDCLFSAPTSAACFVHANDRDGLVDWVDGNGKPLRELIKV